MPLPVPLQELFEEFNRRIDKPIDYNHLLTSLFHELFTLAASVTHYHDEGVIYMDDPVRQKKLSTARPAFVSSYKGGNIKDSYLKAGDVVTMGQQGIYLPRDATLTGMWAKSRTSSNWNFEVRKNGLPITVATIPVVTGDGEDDNVDLDLDAGDWLQFYCDGTAGHPIGVCEIAWRL